MTEKKGLKNVMFLNPVKKDEVCALLKCADIFYIGWHKNNLYKFGISANKLFDYMYAARPVVHSVQKDTNDCILSSGGGISVDAEDHEEIVDAIMKLYTMSEEERMHIGEQGRAFVKDFHTYEKLAAEYLKIFSDINAPGGKDCQS